MRVRTKSPVTTRAGIIDHEPTLSISPDNPLTDTVPKPVSAANHGKGAPATARKQQIPITTAIP